MNTDNFTNSGVATIIAVAFIATAAAFTASGSSPDIAPQQVSEKPGYEATVTATVYNNQGEIVDVHEGENILTNEGANYFRSLATEDTSNPIDWVGLSNQENYDSDVTNEALQGEIIDNGLHRKQGNITHTDTGTWEVEVEWEATGEVTGVEAAGLFPHDVQNTPDDTDANILVAEETMTPKNFQDGYQFELTWEIEQVPG